MRRRLIIDANILLLLVIGAVEQGRHIAKSKRLSKFKLSDYDNVLKIIKEYDQVYVTPYIATEVSNLVDLSGHARTIAFSIAQALFCKQFEMIDVELKEDCCSDMFINFGVTDSSLVRLASEYFILTSDLRLLTSLYESGPKNIIPYVINQ